MIVPDVNLLLYAVHAESEQHATARAWLDKLLTGDEPVGFSWTVLAAFIRVTTNPRVVASPVRLDRATELVDLWLQQRIVSLVEPGPGSLADSSRLAARSRPWRHSHHRRTSRRSVHRARCHAAQRRW